MVTEGLAAASRIERMFDIVVPESLWGCGDRRCPPAMSMTSAISIESWSGCSPTAAGRPTKRALPYGSRTPSGELAVDLDVGTAGAARPVG